MIFNTENFEDGVLEAVKIIIYTAFVYLNLDYEVIGILAGLMTADSLVGSIKSVRLPNRVFETKKLMWGIILKIIFIGIPAFIALIGKGIGFDFTALVIVVIKVMIVEEGISVLSNIYMAKNKVEIKKIDAISLLLMTMRNYFKKLLYILLNKIEADNECGLKERDENEPLT